MKIRIPKLGKSNEEKNKKTFEPLASNEKEKKEPTGGVTIEPKTGEKVKNNHSRVPYKDSVENDVTPKRFIFKRLVDKKLTIILIENTSEVAKAKDTLIKIIKSLVTEGLVSVINYGTAVRKSEIFDVSDFDTIAFLCDDDIGDNACLYDALVVLDGLVSKEYMRIEEDEKERVRINNIEVIGIGTCKDGCSKVSKEVGIDCFCGVARKIAVTTKYFCFTEETFMDAAEIGFRSIGAIFRNY